MNKTTIFGGFKAPARHRTKRGFSLGEILIVIVALGVLSAVVGYTVSNVRESAEVATQKRWAATMTQMVNDAASASILTGDDLPAASADWEDLAGTTVTDANTGVAFSFPPFPSGSTWNAGDFTHTADPYELKRD